VLRFYYFFNRQNGLRALIVDNAEERFNYRNKERAGRGEEKLEERAFVYEMMERFSLIIVTKVQFIKQAVKA